MYLVLRRKMKQQEGVDNTWGIPATAAVIMHAVPSSRVYIPKFALLCYTLAMATLRALHDTAESSRESRSNVSALINLC